MKKFLILLLTLTAAFSLVACGGGESSSPELSSTDPINSSSVSEPDENSSAGGAVTAPDFGSIMGGDGATDIVWGKQDAATKAEIIAAGKADGVDVSFGADGSMSVYDPATGETVTQNPDGTWTIKGGDGSESQVGGNWPDNEFTRLLPKPPFTITLASTNEDEFGVMFDGATTVEQVKAYAEELKAKGFTVDAETTDMDTMGMVIYSYTAKNADGYEVNVFHTMGSVGLSLLRP